MTTLARFAVSSANRRGSFVTADTHGFLIPDCAILENSWYNIRVEGKKPNLDLSVNRVGFNDLATPSTRAANQTQRGLRFYTKDGLPRGLHPQGNPKHTEVRMPKTTLPQKAADSQPQLFNPDLEPIRYIADNATLELTFDGKFRAFWLNQKQMAELFHISVQGVSQQIQNFKDARPDDVESVIKRWLITASDGKQYEVEHYSHQVAIFVGYRAKATQEVIRFQRFVERIFQERLEAEHARAMERAQRRRDQDVTAYRLLGKSQTWAEQRLEVRDTFKALTAQVARVCDDKRIYGRLANEEYTELLGETAQRLRKILHTDNIRDSLTDLQLSYFQLAEQSLALVLRRKEYMTADQLLKAAATAISPLGDHLRAICEASGIDVITGAPLDDQGKPLIMRNVKLLKGGK